MSKDTRSIISIEVVEISTKCDIITPEITSKLQNIIMSGIIVILIWIFQMFMEPLDLKFYTVLTLCLQKHHPTGQVWNFVIVANRLRFLF